MIRSNNSDFPGHTPPSGGPWNYTYDANGLRVEKTNGSTGTLYWRSILGDTVAESDLTASKTNGNYHEYIYFTGRKIARVDGSGSVFFYYADHVGTTRTITDSSGNMCYDADFTPYGQEMVHTNNCPQNYKFTGYERDPETGLDYAFARYYSSRLGRFMSPDPFAGAVDNPQSLNRYAYVGNNPTSFSDPSGLFRTPWGFGGNDFGFGWNWNEFDLLGMALGNTDWPGCPYGDCSAMEQAQIANTVFAVLGMIGPSDIDWSRLGVVSNPPPPGPQAQGQTPQQKYDSCMASFNNSTFGKVVHYGSALSFADNFVSTAKNWIEAIAIKGATLGAFFNGANYAAGGVSTVTATVKPIVADAASAGVAAATLADITARSACTMEAYPETMYQPGSF